MNERTYVDSISDATYYIHITEYDINSRTKCLLKTKSNCKLEIIIAELLIISTSQKNTRKAEKVLNNLYNPFTNYIYKRKC